MLSIVCMPAERPTRRWPFRVDTQRSRPAVLLPGEKHEERAHRRWQLWREPAEEISAGGKSKSDSCPLTRVRQVIETGGKIHVSHKSTGSSSSKVGNGGHGTASIGPVDECEGERMEAPRQHVVTARRLISRVFLCDDSR